MVIARVSDVQRKLNFPRFKVISIKASIESIASSINVLSGRTGYGVRVERDSLMRVSDSILDS